MVDHILELGRAVGRVHVDEDRSDLRGGVLDRDPLCTVRAPDADTIAEFDAESQERFGQPIGCLVEFPIRTPNPLMANDQRVAVRESSRSVFKVLADRLGEERNIRWTLRIRKLHLPSFPIAVP